MPHSGTFAAFFGPLNPGGIFQTIATLPGTVYLVDFWLQNEQDAFGSFTPNSFQFSWDGVTETALVDATIPNYQHFTYNLLATGATTELRFTFTNPGAFWDLDDVSAVAAVPEPNALALALLAGGLGVAVKRRPRQAA